MYVAHRVSESQTWLKEKGKVYAYNGGFWKPFGAGNTPSVLLEGEGRAEGDRACFAKANTNMISAFATLTRKAC